MTDDSSDPRQTPGPEPEKTSDAIIPFGDKLDEIAQERFNKTDWIELVAAFVLAAATILAAWSLSSRSTAVATRPSRCTR